MQPVRFYINMEQYKDAISKVAKKPYDLLTVEEVREAKRKLYGIAKNAFLKTLEELK